VAPGERSRKIQDLLYPAVQLVEVTYGEDVQLWLPLHYHRNPHHHLLLLLDQQLPNHQVSLAGQGA